jgi:hypothetical protein
MSPPLWIPLSLRLGLIVAAQTRLFGDFNAAVAGGNGMQIAGEYS